MNLKMTPNICRWRLQKWASRSKKRKLLVESTLPRNSWITHPLSEIWNTHSNKMLIPMWPTRSRRCHHSVMSATWFPSWTKTSSLKRLWKWRLQTAKKRSSKSLWFSSILLRNPLKKVNLSKKRVLFNLIKTYQIFWSLETARVRKSNFRQFLKISTLWLTWTLPTLISSRTKSKSCSIC